MDVETARRKLDKAETAYRVQQQLALRTYDHLHVGILLKQRPQHGIILVA
jgi:hypothetical protein